MEFQNLQSLINRATAPNSEEEAKHYCTRFTTLVNQEPDGASRAITLLIGKVQSQNEPVALRAIHVMDQCAKNCGKNFQSQIGKFRFLNELIKLVSPKYAGNQTPVAVRSALVQQIKLWATAYKDQPKIMEAYNLLDKTGNTSIKMVEKEFEYAAGEDADKAALLAQLLKSKNKKDLETANRMIKDMVAAEGRKLELDAELLKDVDLIHNNGRLLSEMLANANRTAEESMLLDELHKTCVELRPKLYRLAGQLSDSAQLSSVVEAGETLNKAIELYEHSIGGGPPLQIIGYQPPNINSQKSSNMVSHEVVDRESTSLINLDEERPDEKLEMPLTTNETMSADEFDNFLSAVACGNSVPMATTTTTFPTPAAPLEAGNSSQEGLFGGMQLKTQQPSQAEAPNNADFDSALGLLSLNTTTATATVKEGMNSNNLLDDLFSGPQTTSEVLQPSKPQEIPKESIEEEAPKSDDPFQLLVPGFGGTLSFHPPKPKPEPTLSELSSKARLAPPITVQQIDKAPPPSEISGDVFDIGLLENTSNATKNSENGILQPTTQSSAEIDDIFSTFAVNTEPVNKPDTTASATHDLDDFLSNNSTAKRDEDFGGGLLSGMKITQTVSSTQMSAPAKPQSKSTRAMLEGLSIPLALIQPTPDPPMVIYNSPSVRVSVYKTKNEPEPSIKVWLVTISNSSAANIKKVDLRMSSTDSGSLSLASPNSKSIAAFSPICPTVPIQQVLMTTSDCYNIRYDLSYDDETANGSFELLG